MKTAIILIFLQQFLSRGVLDVNPHLRDAKFLKNENTQAHINQDIPTYVSLDNTSGSWASDRLYADPAYAMMGNTYQSKWTESVDSLGNIQRNSAFNIRDANGYYVKHNQIDQWNGHINDMKTFNVAYGVKYRNGQRRRR